MVKGDLDWCRYSDLVLYFPMSYLSVFIVEKYGMRSCIVIGCFVMIAGSLTRVVVYLGGTIWWWYFGHIVSVASGSLIRTSTSKLASNWFGDKERGFATAVGICSVPFGILISKILTLVIFDDEDKHDGDNGRTWEETNGRFGNFILIQCILSIGLVVPSILLIRNKPPSPPSMVATKPRPVQSLIASGK